MNFTYISPKNQEEALAILAEHSTNAAVLAGGTDLLLAIKDEVKTPSVLIDLKPSNILNSIEEDKAGNLNIGAFTTVREIEKSDLIASKYPFFQKSAAMLGSVQIRNRATIGGNLCNASPCANLALPLLALDAEVLLEKKGGSRKISINDFFISNGITAKADDEMLTHIFIPKNDGKGVFIFHSKRRAMDIAVVAVCINLLKDDDNKITDIRIALGSVAPIPMRAKKAEEMIRGNVLNDKLIVESAQCASDESNPIDDARASAWYRREMVKSLVARGLSSLK